MITLLPRSVYKQVYGVSCASAVTLLLSKKCRIGGKPLATLCTIQPARDLTSQRYAHLARVTSKQRKKMRGLTRHKQPCNWYFAPSLQANS